MLTRARLFPLLRLAAAATVVGGAGIAATNVSVFQAARERSATTLGVSPPFDVAFVPGCHVDGLQPAPMLAARLQTALDIYYAGRARRIMVSGNDAAGETAAMRHWLTARGVPDTDIVADGAGTRTLESVRRASRVYGVRSALICTQPLHMARTLFLAREAGIAAAGAPAPGDAGHKLSWQSTEALKRTLAFTEVHLLARLPPPDPAVALAR